MRGRLALFALVVGCSPDAQRDTGAVGPRQGFPGVAIARDPRGVARIIAAHDMAAPAAGAHVQRLASLWGVAPDKLPVLDAIGDVPVRGGTIARLTQVIDGLPVWGGELHLLVRPGGELHTASGVLFGTDTPR